MALNLSRPIGSTVTNQTKILTVLIWNLKTAWPTKIPTPFLSPLDSLLLDAYIIFQEKL